MDRQSDLAAAPSMPQIAPSYATDPIVYESFRGLLATYPVARETAETVVPAPLSVPETPRCTLWFFDYHTVDGFEPYHEFLLGLPVTHGDERLTYAVYLGLDAVPPLVAGREVWGIPKKEGEITLVEDDTGWHGRFGRRGKQLASATLRSPEPTDDHPLVASKARTAYWKRIPSAARDAPPVVDRIVTSVQRDIEVERALTGPTSVTLADGPDDPLGRFAPVGEVRGFLVELRWTLDREPDPVVHDFRDETG